MAAANPTILATSIGFDGSAVAVHPGPIYAEALRLAEVRGRRARFCIVPSALGDDPSALATFYSAFAELDVELSHLRLFPMPNFEDPRAHLLRQDVIWVAGGSTANLLALWRTHGLDSVFRDCWEAGVVLTGVSAGSVCWHLGGTTDSFGPELRPFTDGLGFLPYSNSPHHDAEEQRRPVFERLIAEGVLSDGYATDNGAGLVYRGTELHEVVSDTAGALGYEVTRREDGTVQERPLPTRELG
ncbi:MAG: peptidase E [Gaiellaceae bacterium]